MQKGITIHSTLQIIFFFSFNNLSARWIIFISADKIISQHSEDLDSDERESRSSECCDIILSHNNDIKNMHLVNEIRGYFIVGRYASYKTEFENFYQTAELYLQIAIQLQIWCQAIKMLGVVILIAYLDRTP